MYKYKSPTEEGYIKFKLTQKEHKDILPNRKITFFTKLDAYYKDTGVTIHYTATSLGKAIQMILFPVSVLLYGVSKLKEIVKDHRDMLFPKKYGSFTSIWVGSKKRTGEPNERFLALEKIYQKRQQ